MYCDKAIYIMGEGVCDVLTARYSVKPLKKNNNNTTKTEFCI